MFEGLSKRLGDVFDKLRGRGALSEADVDAALREVRAAALEADVALPVVRQFIDGVRPKAIGADVIRSVTPGQMVVKIVNDHLVEMLGGTVADLDLNAIPPVVILMVGLQGSGKTTSSAKIGYRLSQGPQGMAAEFGGSFSVKRQTGFAIAFLHERSDCFMVDGTFRGERREDDRRSINNFPAQHLRLTVKMRIPPADD